MNLIQKTFENNNIRIIEKNGEPWFVAVDIAKTLGYINGSRDVQRHCKGGTETVLQVDNQNRKVLIIPESDVYRLIIRSNLPAAEKFEKWLMEEVLPAIRKTGSYSLQIPKSFAEALRLAADQAELIEKQRPKVEFYDQIVSSEDLIDMSRVSTTLAIPGFGRNRLFEFLRELGVLRADNIPYQNQIEFGRFKTVEQLFKTPNGDVKISLKTMVTQKGLDYIRNLVNKKLESVV